MTNYHYKRKRALLTFKDLKPGEAFALELNGPPYRISTSKNHVIDLSTGELIAYGRFHSEHPVIKLSINMELEEI